MEKVYMLRWESRYSDGSEASGLNPVCFKELERARDELNSIEWDEMCYYEDNGIDMEDIKRNTHSLLTEDGFIIDLGDEYTKWTIEEIEVK